VACFKDKSGERFGLLTVVSCAEGYKKTHWHCICDCGNKVVVPGSNIGRSTNSCGCLWKKAVKKEMIGKRFGHLIVVEEAQSKSYKGAKFAMYRCSCKCGGELVTFGMSLRNGDTVSCGCAYSDAGKKRKKPFEHHRADWQFRNKRRRAARLNAFHPYNKELFDLLEKEAYDLVTLRNNLTGVKWQVDHIVPLISKLVCGLHNEFNLRVITAMENNVKGNRYWPDMPAEVLACSN
jgi:hypothetical protein